MGPLVSLLAKFLGRYAVRSASKELLKKFGLQSTKRFFAGLTDDFLATATKKEIIDLAESSIKQTAKDTVSGKVFAKSNARKLADILNKSTDYIEDRVKSSIIQAYANLNNRKLADTLRTLSTPGAGTPGTEGINVLGIDTGGKFIAGKTRSTTYNKARDAALEALRATVVPQTKTEAFVVAYARGLIGELTGTATNSILLATPRAVLSAPKARAFVRTLQSEVEFLRTSGQVKKAAQLQKAINNALGSARDVYGTQQGLVQSQLAGYVSGRLTVPIASTYVFVDKDERKRNIEKFQKSVKPFAKQKLRTWVDSYTRADGTRVKGHYRELAAA